MVKDKQARYLKIQIRKIQRHTRKKWFSPFIGLLAALDNFILIIPTDGLLISSTIMIPKKWLSFAICVAIGSAIGAIGLAYLVELQGLPWLLDFFPDLDQTKTWMWSQEFFVNYGLLCVFIVLLSPLAHHPVIVLAVLAHTPMYKLALVIFCGRFVKYMFLAYIASHSPKYLKKIWGIKSEMEEVGIKTSR